MISLKALTISCVSVALICAAAMTLLKRDIPASSKLASRQTHFVTTSGLELATFFAGLPANANIREHMLHPTARKASGCRQNSGTLPRIINALGLQQTVYAQPLCNDCIFDAVMNYSCTECGYGSYTDWRQDYSSPAGYRYNGEISCNTSGCGENMDECSC
jgi:hypothetical protein